jgi:hypothetical protein
MKKKPENIISLESLSSLLHVTKGRLRQLVMSAESGDPDREGLIPDFKDSWNHRYWTIGHACRICKQWQGQDKIGRGHKMKFTSKK